MNNKLALNMARLAEEAYSVYNINKNKIQVLVQEVDDAITFAFAGSYDILDWIRDGQFTLVQRDDFGFIHDGFADAWDEVRADVRARIAKTDYRKKIYLTGHSLGGALAQLCALNFRVAGYPIEGVYTYGSPRVGSSDWRRKYESYPGLDENTFRIVNGCDLVPNIPHFGLIWAQSEYMMHGYYQLNQIYLSEGKIVPKQESSLTWKFWKIGVNRAMAHKMENYIKQLRRLA